MSDEEKKAIEYLNKYINWETAGERRLDKDIQTVLELINKQQSELEKKDKIIDLALEYISHQIPTTYREQKPYIFDNIEKILKGKELTDN